MEPATEKFIDRESLKLRNAFEAPLPGIETQIAGIFGGVMGVAPVGAEDDFYDLGGDSLLGEQISMEILRVTGKVFPISNLFENGTPRAVAASLADSASKVSPSTARETFFIVHGRGGYTVLRPTFKAGIESDARISVFELPGIRGDAPFPRTALDVARAYVDQIEREQPEGPVRLASFCMGGLIALEMAHMLEERGRTIGGLVLLDPGSPKPMRQRLRAEGMLEKDPSSLRARLLLFCATGRLSKDNAFLETVWLRLRAIANMSGSLKKPLGIEPKKALHRNAGLKDWPRAWLTATYRHAWPRPTRARVHILASAGRTSSFTRTDGIWQHLLPNRSVHTLVGSHHEIGGDSPHVASAMEALLLGGEMPEDVTRAASHAPERAVTSGAHTGMPAIAVS